MILSGSRPTPPVPTKRLPIAVVFGWTIVSFGIALTAVSALIRLTWRYQDSIPKPLRELLIVNQETSIVSWLSIVVVFALGLCCIAAGRLERRRGWTAIGALFLYLSMDDSTTLHERIGWLMTAAHGDSPVYWWIRVLGPVLAGLGLFTFWFLWRRYAGDLRSRLTTLAGFGCLALALLCEIPERYFHESNLRFRGFSIERYTQHLEEFCELIGPVLILVPIGILVERLVIAAVLESHSESGEQAAPRLHPRALRPAERPKDVA